MPGQVVSFLRYHVTSGPKTARRGAGRRGRRITSNPMMRPYDPTRPYDVFKGSNINPNQVVAPLVGPGWATGEAAEAKRSTCSPTS